MRANIDDQEANMNDTIDDREDIITIMVMRNYLDLNNTFWMIWFREEQDWRMIHYNNHRFNCKLFKNNSK